MGSVYSSACCRYCKTPITNLSDMGMYSDPVCSECREKNLTEEPEDWYPYERYDEDIYGEEE